MYQTYAKPKRKHKAALAFPCHSVEGYPVVDGWREFALDFKSWCAAQGLDAAVCLHPNDYARETIRETIEGLGVAVTCIGGLFAVDYLARCAALIQSYEVVVVDSATSAMFYAGYLGVPVICRGDPLRTLPYHPHDSVEKDHEWVLKQFPWANGSAGADSAAVELGADLQRTPVELRAILLGETEQIGTWAGEVGTGYTGNKAPSERAIAARAETWRLMLNSAEEEIRFDSVLEVGCGGGANLAALKIVKPDLILKGADPNELARKIAGDLVGIEISDNHIPGWGVGDDEADFVLTAGVLIHIDPALWRTAVANLVRKSRKYVCLLEYGDVQTHWNGHLGRGDFGEVLRDCGCEVIVSGAIPGDSDLGTHYWIADVGDKQAV